MYTVFATLQLPPPWDKSDVSFQQLSKKKKRESKKQKKSHMYFTSEQQKKPSRSVRVVFLFFLNYALLLLTINTNLQHLRKMTTHTKREKNQRLNSKTVTPYTVVRVFFRLGWTSTALPRSRAACNLLDSRSFRRDREQFWCVELICAKEKKKKILTVKKTSDEDKTKSEVAFQMKCVAWAKKTGGLKC